MSGETEAQVSGWTTDTLHTHLMRQLDQLRAQLDRQWEAERRAVDLAFAAQSTAMNAALSSAKEAVAAALAAQKEAVTVQADTLKQRADVQNEWRASLNDVLARAMPRIEAEAIINRATERIQELITSQQHMVTRTELEASHRRETERISELSDRMTELANRITRAEATAQGAAGNKAALYAFLGMATAVIVAVVIVINLVTGS